MDFYLTAAIWLAGAVAMLNAKGKAMKRKKKKEKRLAIATTKPTQIVCCMLYLYVVPPTTKQHLKIKHSTVSTAKVFYLCRHIYLCCVLSALCSQPFFPPRVDSLRGGGGFSGRLAREWFRFRLRSLAKFFVWECVLGSVKIEPFAVDCLIDKDGGFATALDLYNKNSFS